MTLVFLIVIALVTGLSLLAVGPLFMSGRQESLVILLVLVTQLFPLRAVSGFAAVLRRRRRVSLSATLLLLVEIVSLALLVALPFLSKPAFMIFLEGYLSFIVTIKAIDTFLYARARQWSFFIPSVVATALGAELFRIILFNTDGNRENAVFFALGILLMVFGTGQLCDFISLVVRNRKVNKVLRNIRLALPDITGLLVPLRTAELLPEEVLQKSGEDRRGQVEVLFQVSGRGISMAGHCELCVDGYTFTYGAYDPATARVFKTLGDGILVRAPRDEYLFRCIHTYKKKVISYRLQLDEEQERLLREQITELEADLIPWEPRLSPKAFASQLQQIPGLRFYRIAQGRFHKYFIPTINCVSLTDSLLGKTDIGHANIIGIKTPGAYMDHLERQYLADKGIVTDRRVYTKAAENEQ